GFIEEIQTWDPDGPGPLNEQLIVAGDLQSVAGMTVHSIAAFDGTTWSDLGGGLPGEWLGAVGSFPLDPAQPEVYHLLVSEFLSSNFLHVWDGTTWRQEFYETFRGSVYDFASYDLDADGLRDLVAAG